MAAPGRHAGIAVLPGSVPGWGQDNIGWGSPLPIRKSIMAVHCHPLRWLLNGACDGNVVEMAKGLEGSKGLVLLCILR